MKLTREDIISLIKEKNMSLEEILGYDFKNINNKIQDDIEQDIYDINKSMKNGLGELSGCSSDISSYDPEIDSHSYLGDISSRIDSTESELDMSIYIIEQLGNKYNELYHSYDSLKEIIIDLLTDVELPEEYLYFDNKDKFLNKIERKNKIKNILK